MGRVAPRLLTARRWELNEKIERFSGLVRLRATIERQLGAMGEASENEDHERTERREHLEDTIHQLDTQMNDARSEVASSARVLRLLESGGAKVGADHRVAP